MGKFWGNWRLGGKKWRAGQLEHKSGIIGLSLKHVKIEEKLGHIGNHQPSFERYHVRPRTASLSPRLGIRNPQNFNCYYVSYAYIYRYAYPTFWSGGTVPPTFWAYGRKNNSDFPSSSAHVNPNNIQENVWQLGLCTRNRVGAHIAPTHRPI